MNREMVQQHLQQAERHVAQGEAHIARQREIVAQLTGAGRMYQAAIDLLAQFENMQASHIADRDRLRKELNELA